MRTRDFVAFSSTLKPLELKAIGELSWVRHLAEGDVLYSPSEPGNALYVINRGALEVVTPRKAGPPANMLRLTRGDVIGDVEVFGDTPRLQLVRAQEASSLQCFPRANFPELLRRVPSFFKYVCEQVACRLLKEREINQTDDGSLHLSGNISKFDLTTIHQTIMSSGQTGELSIRDGRGEPLGAFFFEMGRPCAGQFEHLTGHEAFWQLFLADNLAGTFSFSVGERAMTSWIQSSEMTALGGDLLITALQYRDELDALKKGMHDPSAKFRARSIELRWSGAAAEDLRPVAQQIWDLLQRAPRTTAELYRQCNVSELKIFQVIAELLYSDQIALVNAANPSATPPPLPMENPQPVGATSS